MRFVTSFAAALLCASFAVHAQETTTKVKVDDDKANQVIYTGCVQTGTEAQTFLLDKVVPVTTQTTQPTGTGGSITTTSTSYVLVPGGQAVTLQKAVGHKVQVT